MQPVFKVLSVIALVGAMLGASNRASAEWVEWVFAPGIDYRYEDNLNLSSFDADERSDDAMDINVHAGRYLQIGERTRLRLTAGFEAGFFDTYKLLNNVAFSANAVVTHKLGLGKNAAWISPYVVLGYREVRDDIRSGMFMDLGITTGKRLTDRFDMTASLAYRESEGKDGVQIVPGIGADVFDQDRWLVSVQGNFLITNRLILQGDLSHYEGDFVSACTKGNVGTVLAVEDVRAITLDDVFSGCVYRLNGSGNSGALSLSYATGRHSSINASVTYLKGKGDELEYDNTVLQVGFLYNY